MWDTSATQGTQREVTRGIATPYGWVTPSHVVTVIHLSNCGEREGEFKLFGTGYPV